MSRSMLGLSLSFCIADILNGRIQEEEVICIIAGTRAQTEAEWDRLIGNYEEFYWRKDPLKAEAIVRRLRKQGRIHQPRIHTDHQDGIQFYGKRHPAAPHLTDGHWRWIDSWGMAAPYIIMGKED